MNAHELNSRGMSRGACPGELGNQLEVRAGLSRMVLSYIVPSLVGCLLLEGSKPRGVACIGCQQ